MATVALTFGVLEIDGSPGALALVLAARTGACCLLLLVGGVVADRFPRRVVLQTAHAAAALSQSVVAVLLLTHTASIATLVVLEAVNGAVTAFTMPAMLGIVPEPVPRPLLQQANALLSFTRSGMQILGPTVAALLVVGVGAGWALAFDALTYVLAIG